MLARRTRRGKNSARHNQRREAARIVSQAAVRDLLIKESINTLNSGQIAAYLQTCTGTFDALICNSYDRGEVLSDSLGRGTLQQVGALMD